MKIIKTVLLFALFGSVSLLAVDYSTMSTDELLSQRGIPKTQEERSALHNELTKRYEHMTQEQKQAFDNRPGKGMKGQGQGQGMGRNQ